jgi:hypothetical protein
MKKRKAIHRRASNKKIAKARPAINENALTIIPRRLLPGTVTATSWTPPKGMKSEQWVSAGATLSKIEGMVQFWLGDWWAFGEHHYGDRAQAIRDGSLGDYSLQTLANYAWVARAVKASHRREVLSFKHHEMVVGLPAKQQRQWLDRAEHEQLSAAAMKALIDQDQEQEDHSPEADEDDNTEFPADLGNDSAIDGEKIVPTGGAGETASEVHHDQPRVEHMGRVSQPMSDDAKWRFNLNQGGHCLLHIPHTPITPYLHPDVPYTADQWDVIAEFLKNLAAAMRNTVAALDEAIEENKTLAGGRDHRPEGPRPATFAD